MMHAVLYLSSGMSFTWGRLGEGWDSLINLILNQGKFKAFW